MTVKIRLSRRGRKRYPVYKIVIADSRAPRDGRYKEQIGSYFPMIDKNDPNRVTIKIDKLNLWQSRGAQATSTVERLIKIVQKRVVTPNVSEESVSS